MREGQKKKEFKRWRQEKKRRKDRGVDEGEEGRRREREKNKKVYRRVKRKRVKSKAFFISRRTTLSMGKEKGAEGEIWYIGEWMVKYRKEEKKIRNDKQNERTEGENKEKHGWNWIRFGIWGGEIQGEDWKMIILMEEPEMGEDVEM